MKYLKFWIKVVSLILLWGFILPHFVHAQPGAPDPAFGGGDGFSTTSFLTDGHAYPGSVSVQPDGRIVVAGGAWIPDGTENEYIALARFMPNGSLDITFGNGSGHVTTAPANMYAYLAKTVVLPDGKILGIGGAFNFVGTDHYFLLARFNNNGTLDSSFDGDGFVATKIGNFNQYGNALALQTNGKIVVAGTANITGYSEIVVLRYHANGALDNTFGGGDGVVDMSIGESYSGAVDVEIQPDGKIVAACLAVKNGFEEFAALRLKSDGTLDPSFGNGGILIPSYSDKDDRVCALALQTDGKILLAGYTSTGSNNDGDMAVARFNANGSADNSFGDHGLATAHLSNYGEQARDIVIQPDGKILLGGIQGGAPGERRDFAIVRFTSNGVLDHTFNGTGLSSLNTSAGGSNVEALALQKDGKLLAAGPAWNSQSQRHFFAVARLLTGVTVDTNTPNVIIGRTLLFPNPVQEQATLQYELSSTTQLSINLYDMQGRFIQNILPSTEKTAGKHSETLIKPSGIPGGNYLLTIESNSGVSAIEVIF